MDPNDPRPSFNGSRRGWWNSEIKRLRDEVDRLRAALLRDPQDGTCRICAGCPVDADLKLCESCFDELRLAPRYRARDR